MVSRELRTSKERTSSTLGAGCKEKCAPLSLMVQPALIVIIFKGLIKIKVWKLIQGA